MASEESVKMLASTGRDEVCEDAEGSLEHGELQQNLRTSLSRLSVCTTSMFNGNEVDDLDYDGDEDDAETCAFMSKFRVGRHHRAEKEASSTGEEYSLDLISSDSDKESVRYSLPVTPNRRRRRRKRRASDCAGVDKSLPKGTTTKEFASAEGVKKNSRRERKATKGEQGSAGGVGVALATRPKGGEQSLSMGLEEVRACRELGFDFDHGRVLEAIPGLVSVSAGSGFETSSGGNSPLPMWRISAPGDDPRDVKARLKVWAQVVALASTSQQGSSS